MNILCVEDTPSDLDLVVRALSEGAPGASCVTATSVEQAIKLILSGTPPIDFVLSDMNLPDGTALDLHDFIRAERDTPFIVLTGADDDLSVLNALNQRVDDYLLKQGDYLQRLPSLILEVLTQRLHRRTHESDEIRVLYVIDSHRLFGHTPPRRLQGREFSIRVSCVSSFNAAIEYVRKSSFDMMVVDAQEPAAVLHFVKSVRQQFAAGMPSLLLSCGLKERIGNHALRLGAMDYVEREWADEAHMGLLIESVYLRHLAARERQTLRDTEHAILEITSACGLAFWLLDPATHQVRYVSTTFEKMFCVSAERLYGDWWHWLDALHPADRADLQRLDAPPRRPAYEIVVRVAGVDGQFDSVLMQGFPLRDALGRTVRLAGVARYCTPPGAPTARHADAAACMPHGAGRTTGSAGHPA